MGIVYHLKRHLQRYENSEMINTVMISSKIKDKGILAINNANLFFLRTLLIEKCSSLRIAKKCTKTETINKIKKTKVSVSINGLSFKKK
ncbi:hypothetical protein HMPREF2136_07255 [Prevotella bivia DNF00650]|nr:hypothetical protein HMPREF2136_07255 [Prevotella bivia DNF00650]